MTVNNIFSGLPQINREVISKYRTELMGLSIIFVLFYHFFCWVANPLGNLNKGYLGVDIFFFLSGFGLTYSFQKSVSLIEFYKKRFIKIYPLYFITVILVYVLTYDRQSLYNLVCNLTTLGYYTNFGRQRFDWYLESLFTIYLIFPVLYKLCKYKNYTIGIALLFCIGSLAFLPIPWWYDCFISRIVIFIIGIMTAKYNHSRDYLLLSFIGILFFPLINKSSIYISISLITPLFIYFLCYLFNILEYRENKCVLKLLNMLGGVTLELYCANAITQTVLNLYCNSLSDKIAGYIFSQIILSIILIIFNRKIHLAYNWMK